ncbi:hypothetical protein PLICBS_000082, partial [Purpureocillium lilacinum]|uniref:uncharacterized protein n=1 Tax=Purpureocillium lilacinum TaxID=33203 RepID=UPI002089E8B8
MRYILELALLSVSALAAPASIVAPSSVATSPAANPFMEHDTSAKRLTSRGWTYDPSEHDGPAPQPAWDNGGWTYDPSKHDGPAPQPAWDNGGWTYDPSKHDGPAPQPAWDNGGWVAGNAKFERPVTAAQPRPALDNYGSDGTPDPSIKFTEGPKSPDGASGRCKTAQDWAWEACKAKNDQEVEDCIRATDDLDNTRCVENPA